MTGVRRDLDWSDVLADAERQEDEGPNYPETNYPETIPCFRCLPVNGMERRVLGEGPVTNRADPTQTYRLECGHLAI
jgi:hypothetical protein